MIHSALLPGMYLTLAMRIRQRGINPSFNCVRGCKCPQHERKTNYQTFVEVTCCVYLLLLTHLDASARSLRLRAADASQF